MSQDYCKTSSVLIPRVAVGAVTLSHRAGACRTAPSSVPLFRMISQLSKILQCSLKNFSYLATPQSSALSKYAGSPKGGTAHEPHVMAEPYGGNSIQIKSPWPVQTLILGNEVSSV